MPHPTSPPARNKNYGSVLLKIPSHFHLASLAFFFLACLFLFIIFFVEYTDKFIVKGYLNSTKGIVSLYPRKNGLIISMNAKVGAKVKKGDELFRIDSSYEKTGKPTRILKLLKKRKLRLEKDILRKESLLKKLKPLLKNHFISESTYTSSLDELKDLKTQLSQVEIDIIHYQQTILCIVHAPIDGIVSNINFQTGQETLLSKPVLKLLRANDELVAEVFIPVAEAGFINKQSELRLRFDAYPFEHFGTYKAKIQTINRTVLTDEEEDKPLHIGQPYYKITALLDSQFVKVYGKPKRLKHGMTLSAVILGSKRKIWQWILDPLYSFYGELFT